MKKQRCVCSIRVKNMMNEAPKQDLCGPLLSRHRCYSMKSLTPVAADADFCASHQRDVCASHSAIHHAAIMSYAFKDRETLGTAAKLQ